MSKAWQMAAAASMLAVVLAGAGCKSRKQETKVQRTDEEGPRVASVVHVADPQAAAQLVAGFYDIENNSWRWTAGKFSVLLRPPAGASAKGATLVLKGNVPEAVVTRVKSMTLTASINGTNMPAETYTKGAELEFTKNVPANLLQGDAVKVDFSLDHFLTPGQVDQRELGLVVSSIGLEAK